MIARCETGNHKIRRLDTQNVKLETICMTLPSDVYPIVESIQQYLFYFVGTFSLLVNSMTLTIIIRKSSILDREIRRLTLYLQVIKVVFVFKNLFCILDVLSAPELVLHYLFYSVSLSSSR